MERGEYTLGRRPWSVFFTSNAGILIVGYEKILFASRRRVPYLCH